MGSKETAILNHPREGETSGDGEYAGGKTLTLYTTHQGQGPFICDLCAILTRDSDPKLATPCHMVPQPSFLGEVILTTHTCLYENLKTNQSAATRRHTNCHRPARSLSTAYEEA